MMTATTVSSNTCDNTSAIYVEDQPANIVGCTISGNSGSVGDALRFAADDKQFCVVRRQLHLQRQPRYGQLRIRSGRHNPPGTLAIHGDSRPD